MRRTILSAAVLLAFVAFPAAHLSAQQMMEGNAQPGNDAMSINLFGGGFFSTNTLATGTEFENTGSAGGSATFWAHENVGVRANLLWAAPSVQTAEANPLAGEDPNIWSYSGDVLLRMPLAGMEQMSWFPYIVGGLGAKTYDFETLETATDFAGNVGAGVELRFGENNRFGINTEVRDFLSNFERLGFEQTLNDVIWTGGFTVNY